LYLHDDSLGYTSPKPEDKSKVKVIDEGKIDGKGESNGEVEDKDDGEGEENLDLEEQEEVDADPFADELEDELDASKGQSKLDRELDGKEDVQEQTPNIYTPNYAKTMHDSFRDINMHGSIHPEDHSTFQNINMHGFIQSTDPSNLAMHDGNSYFMDTTNFHSIGTYSADPNLLFSSLNYWPPATGPTGQYNPLKNLQTLGQFPSYPQQCSYPLSQPSNLHPSDGLPILPYIPSGNSPGNPHPSDMLPPLLPVQSGTSPASPHPPDTLPPPPPVHTENPPLPEFLLQGNPHSAPDMELSVKASGMKVSGAKASSVKVLDKKVSSKKMSDTKASGVKAPEKEKPEPPTHQAKTTMRKSAHPPKPSTCNEMANAIGAQALSELQEKENSPAVGKKACKHGPDIGGEPIAKYCAFCL
jgi:hypothetical protein